MTRETRIALVVGLAFIVLFGVILSRRSLVPAERAPARTEVARTAPAGAPVREVRPSPEVMAAAWERAEERPALAPAVRPPAATPAPAPAPGPAGAVHLAVGPGPSPMPASGPSSPGPGAGPVPPTPGAGVTIVRGPPPPVAGPAPVAGPIPGVFPPPGSRPAPAGSTYTVQPGDTLIKIAANVYGREHQKEYPRILEANRDKISSPTRLSVGQVLVIPELEVASAGARGGPAGVAPLPPIAGPTRGPESGAPPATGRAAAVKIYVVQPGDCLSVIASREMGTCRGGTVERLLKANADQLSTPVALKAGMKLRIPE